MPLPLMVMSLSAITAPVAVNPEPFTVTVPGEPVTYMAVEVMLLPLMVLEPLYTWLAAWAAEAMAALERAIKLRPDDEVAWYRLARARQAMGERDEALKAMMEFRRIHEAAQQTSSAPAATDEVTPQALDSDANPQ